MARRNRKKKNVKTIMLVVLPVLLVFGAIYVLTNMPIGSRATNRLLNATRSAGVNEITWLIRAGANVNDNSLGGWTPLMLAASHNPNADVLRVLIERGADVNAVFDDGMTPLMMAALYNSNPDVLRILLESDANTGVRDISGLRALDHADRNEALRGTGAYNLLLEKTMPILLAGVKATNVLLSSSHEAGVGEVTWLIQEGADINGADSGGWTPLMRASRYNEDPAVLRVLLENGADANAVSDEGWTSLMYAARNNPNPEIIKVLVENGADVNAVCNYGNTALIYAAKFNPSPETTRILLENGADVSIRNRGGDMALTVAEDNALLLGTDVYGLLREMTLEGE